MADQFNRWAQIVRKPGSAAVHAWHPTQVPAEGSDPPYTDARAGIRLLVQPLAMANPVNTIDITSTAVMAMLEGFLASGTHIGKTLSWRSRGFGVYRRDTVRVSNKA